MIHQVKLGQHPYFTFYKLSFFSSKPSHVHSLKRKKGLQTKNESFLNLEYVLIIIGSKRKLCFRMEPDNCAVNNYSVHHYIQYVHYLKCITLCCIPDNDIDILCIEHTDL